MTANRVHPWLDFGRDWCGDFAISGSREWLATNGLGGYACGTAAGQLSRRYHGLLVAALSPPVGRTLLLAKLDESVAYSGQAFHLFTNQYPDGCVDPKGFCFLERFHLEGATPVWSYACSDALIDKRVWMAQGQNTTYIRYDLRRASQPLDLLIRPLVNHRDHNEITRAENLSLQVESFPSGFKITAAGGAPFYLLSLAAKATMETRWHRDFFLAVEAERGLADMEDHFSPGIFTARLLPGEWLTLVASTQSDADLDGTAAWSEKQAHEDRVVELADRSREQPAPGWLRQLALAADQFIVQRPLPGEPKGRTIIAGYPWFGDWGRDTMISLPGLTLITGRAETARQILRTFARYADRGMLPNNFPELGEAPGYNTADATLWYFEALRAYIVQTGDEDLLRQLYPVLEEIVAWHRRGTRFQIHLDPQDGLIYAGEAGVQLTWMDVKIGDWVITPRTGKPVEINALWYNALSSLAWFSRRLGKPDEAYARAAEQARRGFRRFWNEAAGYCFDVIDGPEGNEATLRPNQLFAVSLPHSPLEAQQQRAVVDACARQLLTSHGLRSLAPKDEHGRDYPNYDGVYRGDLRTRDAAYHQGTVWGWLIGPFVSAHLRVYGDTDLAESFLMPLVRQVTGKCVGNLSEIFDGEPPHAPRGAFAQAWTVAEVLRAWGEIETMRVQHGHSFR